MTLAAATLGDTLDWIQAHTALSRLARQRAAADAEEGRWMVRALRSAAHVHMACGSFAQYIERLFGYDRRTTQEKLRVAEALEDLPQLAHALEVGAICWSAVRELTRVAVPETEPAWLDAARGKTVREIEALVASQRPGGLPDAPANPMPRAHVLRFEVAPETYALFREAVQGLRRAAGGALDDDALLLSMARHVLGGPGDDGRAAYQVSLSVCPACRAGQQLGGGELVPVDDVVVAMAECDAQNLGPVLPRVANENGGRDGGGMRAGVARSRGEGDEAAGFGAAGSAAVASFDAASFDDAHAGAAARKAEPTRRAKQPIALAVDREQSSDARGQASLEHSGVQAPTRKTEPMPGVAAPAPQRERMPDPRDEMRFHDAHAGARAQEAGSMRSAKQTVAPPSRRRQSRDARGDTSSHDASTWAPAQEAEPVARARQTVAPALRRAVLLRDHGRCRVPGCTHSTFVDVHHIQLRAEGGANTARNIITLCSAHHRAVHRGQLIIRQAADGAVTFWHADGTPYGDAVAPAAVDAHVKVFSALRHLGFREREVKLVLAELLDDETLHDATVEALLREALRRIGSVKR